MTHTEEKGPFGMAVYIILTVLFILIILWLISMFLNWLNPKQTPPPQQTIIPTKSKF